MIISSSVYEKTHFQGFLKEFLKLFKCLASRNIHTIKNHQIFESPLQSSSPREKDKKVENFHKACIGLFKLWSFSPYL